VVEIVRTPKARYREAEGWDMKGQGDGSRPPTGGSRVTTMRSMPFPRRPLNMRSSSIRSHSSGRSELQKSLSRAAMSALSKGGTAVREISVRS